MSEPIIQISDLSKRYRLGVMNRQSLQDELRYWWHRARGRNPRRFMGTVVHGTARQGLVDPGELPNEFWALKDISFNVEKGEIVGIVGANGAGKSTLLKILSRITGPTSGEAVIDGRVGSLLEVGTGFHPELTGRENVYLNGTILGMRRREVEAKFDEIVAFSEIERFIDTPVKRYSSGMYVRLAFAVAAHLEPEILLVDEVLAVGDAAFQKKCLGRMGDVAQHGRTILFVSHNMTAVHALCSRAVWLEGGGVRRIGDVADVVSEYLRSTTRSVSSRSWDSTDAAVSNADVWLQHASVRPILGSAGEAVTTRTALDIEIALESRRPGTRLHVSLSLFNANNICVFSTTSQENPEWRARELATGSYQFVCHVPQDLLSEGMYRVLVRIVRDSSVILCKVEDAVSFEVHSDPQRRSGWYGKYGGVVRPVLAWTAGAAQEPSGQ